MIPVKPPPVPTKASVKTTPRAQADRRKVLRSLAAGAGVIGAGLLGFIGRAAHSEPRLRPPGAVDERDFLAACIKCGQCVQVCPVEAIKLADLFEGFGMGAPYVVARDQACDFSCDATQCILACPTGALTHAIDKKEQVRMGVAELVRPEACLARQGKGWKGAARAADFKGRHRWTEVNRWKPIPVVNKKYDLDLCDLCVRECPIEGAIALEPVAGDASGTRREPKVREACVGCGVCEMMCPAEPAAIVIAPRIDDRHRAHPEH